MGQFYKKCRQSNSRLPGLLQNLPGTKASGKRLFLKLSRKIIDVVVIRSLSRLSPNCVGAARSLINCDAHVRAQSPAVSTASTTKGLPLQWPALKAALPPSRTGFKRTSSWPTIPCAAKWRSKSTGTPTSFLPIRSGSKPPRER